MVSARLPSLTLLFTLLWAAPVTAQDRTGTVAGRVLDAGTRSPLAGAYVTVAERGALTNDDGRFAVSDVPAGLQTVRVALLGYGEATEAVTVVAGESVEIEIVMTTQAIELDRLVVTGYGEQRAGDLAGVITKVSPEEFNTGRIVSPEQLIQGKVAGVQIIDSGEPGGGISLRIRGGTSVTSSNEPLFVVDGVPLPVGGGLSAGRNALNFLNPEDIASITVMKDASATAIYGSRGANGVVVIETKSGAPGAQISYTGSISGSQVTEQLDLLDPEQFRRAVSERAPENMDLLGSASTDWRDAIARSAVGQEHTLAFSGGSGGMNYRLSLGYLDQGGVIRSSETERVSAALAYSQLFLNDQLRVQANLRGSRTADEFTPGGVLGGATAFAPTQPIRDPDSPFGGFFEWADPLGPNNPVAALELVTDEGTTYRSIGNVRGELRLPFLQALSANVNIGYDVTKSERLGFAPSIVRDQAENGLGGTVNRENFSLTNTVVDAYLNYETDLGAGDNRIDVTAGYSYEDSRGDYPSFRTQGLSFDLLGPFGIPAAEDERTFLTVEESRLVSGFARLNYSLSDRYLLTLSVRRDGSSRFGPDQQWGTFPSAAVAWRISAEPFMERFDAISDLKLRLSWGVNGNQAFPNYRAFSDYVIGDAATRAQFGDEFVTTIRPSAADPAIKWEETTSYNIGIDYALFGNRLGGSIDFYQKDTEDLIFTVPVAAGTNLSNFVTTNIGSMENRGVELAVNALVFDGTAGGFLWDVGFNASTNHNELVRINSVGGGGEQILTGGIEGGVGSNIQVLQPGHPINSFFVYRHKRRADGRPVHADENGDGNINEDDLYVDLNGDGIVNQDDRSPFESPAPKWIFGHTSALAYRNLDLSLALRAHIGSYVYNNVASTRGHYSALRGGAPTNLHASVLENEFDNPQYFSDVYVEDASFLRLDNVTLGYTFQPFGAGQPMRVFGTVQNVFTLTGYSGIDPTAGVNGIDTNIYPRALTFVAGVGVRF